jgi:hypothetical protein
VTTLGLPIPENNNLIVLFLASMILVTDRGEPFRMKNDMVKNDMTQISQKSTSNNQRTPSTDSAQTQPNFSTGTFKPMQTNVPSKGCSTSSLPSNLAGTNTANGYLYGQQTRFNGNMLTGTYANTASHGFWPTGYGGYYTAHPQAPSNIFTTPTKGSKVYASSKTYPKLPLTSSNTNDTSVFDENTELKERIKELEAQLGLNAKPVPRKNAFKGSCDSVKIQPDQSLSVNITPVKEVKKDPETPLKIDTPIKDLNKHDRRWITRYEELVTYQKTHGHTMVPSAFKPLGTWVSRQRQEKKKGMLSEERTAMLQHIDFVWVAK